MKSAQIAALLLEGKSSTEIEKAVGANRGHIYKVRLELKRTGQLAGRNVG